MPTSISNSGLLHVAEWLDNKFIHPSQKTNQTLIYALLFSQNIIPRYTLNPLRRRVAFSRLIRNQSSCQESSVKQSIGGNHGPEFDAIIMESGFGGAVSALRLAEGGYRVLVRSVSALEARRVPSITRSDWLWNEGHPERSNGWLDIRQRKYRNCLPETVWAVVHSTSPTL